MTEPRVQTLLNGYKFIWSVGDAVFVSVVITKLYEHTRGNITGEIEVNHEMNDIPILSGIRINLTSQQARNTIAKRLLTNPDVKSLDWPKMIDDICAATIILNRQGEPVKELWTHEEFEKPTYLLHPILVKGLPTIIFGEKGVAKSTLSLVIYICLSLPWSDNPLGLSVPDKSTKTLILDWETESNIVQYYANKLQVGMELPPIPVYYRRCGLPLVDDIEQIQAHIEELNAEVVIIDSLGAAAGGDLKTPEIALRFFAALRKLRVTSLIIAQTAKADDGKNKTVFGSTYFQYYARSIFELCKAETISDEDMDIALFHRMANLSALSQPMGFRLHHNDTGIVVESSSVDIHDFKKKINAQMLILDALKQGMLTVDEIAVISGVDVNSIRPILTKLKKRNRVVNPQKGKWGLYAQEVFN